MDTQVNTQEILAHQTSKFSQSKGEFAKILVAVDYLPGTPRVFEQALQLAKACASQLTIFHCVQGQMPGMPEMLALASRGAYGGIYAKEMLELEEQLLREVTEELQAWLRSFCKRAEEAGIRAEFDYQIGEPGTKICALAKSWGADLIILGRRGRSGLSEIFLGSVSNYVVHHAPCSVLVVQH